MIAQLRQILEEREEFRRDAQHMQAVITLRDETIRLLLLKLAAANLNPCKETAGQCC